MIIYETPEIKLVKYNTESILDVSTSNITRGDSETEIIFYKVVPFK